MSPAHYDGALLLRIPLLLAAVVPLAACGRDPGATSTRSSVIESDGTATIAVDGVLLSVDPDVRFVQHLVTTVSASESSRSKSATLDGHPFGVEHGRFHVGPEDYGPVIPGDRVRVSREGVFVRGERRGALPRPRER